MRKFRLDDKIVLCKNSSGMGFSSWKCKRGNIIVYKEWYGILPVRQPSDYHPRMGRSLGRVICEKDGLENCTGYICTVVPDESFNFCYIRWIDPDDVIEVRMRPRFIPGQFFELVPNPSAKYWPQNNEDALDLAKHVEKGYWSEPEKTKPNIK